MAFVPVSIGITTSAGGETSQYNRAIELTARQLETFGGSVMDMTEPLTAVAGDIRGTVEEAFASQGATGASGRWAVLSPNYAAWKAKKGAGLPILFGLRPTSWVGHRSNPPGQRRNMHQTYAPSGAMMRSLLSPLEDLITWHITPNRLRYTPTSPIAGYHETGTEKMPARPPVDPSIAFLHSIDRQFVRWIAGLQKKSGL
jgi:hypothetical protein